MDATYVSIGKDSVATLVVDYATKAPQVHWKVNGLTTVESAVINDGTFRIKIYS